MFRKMVCFLVLPLTLAGLAGCGGGTVKVEGMVTLDGTPVQGATVSFVPQDSTGKPAAGVTDASGNFSLSTSSKAGAFSGTYKVVVTKTEAASGDMKPGSPEYTKMMQKGIPKPGPMMGSAGPKSLLPAVYAKADSTPLTQKVPPEGPVKLELKSK